ncbi:hypothetical protein BGZ90_002880 [Linnemannia elongata]|nr:hypothetical protein BGZ90_002880 [Linnemannia elongata]
MGGDKIQFSFDKNQKDAQYMAEEIKQKVRNEIAKRNSSRDRSSSIERDAVQSFMSKHGEELVASMLVEWLGGGDAIDRKVARQVIPFTSRAGSSPTCASTISLAITCAIRTHRPLPCPPSSPVPHIHS